MNEQEGKEYYLSRKSEILTQFDTHARSSRRFLVPLYGGEFAEAVLRDAREQLEALIPQIPYIGGDKNPMTRHLVRSTTSLVLYKVMKARGKTAEEIGKVIYDGVEGDPYRNYFQMPEYLTKMIDKKLLGAKTDGLGFYKTENRKAVAAYDIDKEDYRELKRPRFDSVEAALKEKDIIKRVHKLVYPENEDRGSEIARRFMGLLLKYTDMLTGTIGEAQDIEIAMCYGLNHRVGPVGFLQSEYGDAFRKMFPN